MLFKIHDAKNQNYIEKHDLIKFLYNYPDRDVFKLIRESGEFKDLGVKPQDDNLVKPNKGGASKPRPNHNLKRRSEYGINLDATMMHEERVMNLTEMVNKKTIDAYKNNGKTHGLTAQPFNIQPTTINNKIKLIADLIFKRYGKNKRLEYDEFCQWMKLHKQFLATFREWFKPDLWVEYDDEQMNKGVLSFHKKTPLAQDHVKTQKFRSSLKTSAYIKLYDHFLMIFKNEKDLLPYRVIILKLLDISYNFKKRKVLIAHPNKAYDKIKLILPDDETLAKWKRILDNYTNDSVSNRYEYGDGEIIGKGKFSRVYRVKERGSSNEYALKTIDKKSLLDEERQVLINEASIMQLLNHTNIIRLYQSIETNEYYFYVLELVKGSDLYRYVSKKKFLDEYEASWIMKNLLEALEYLHSTGIVHRDLKPENIMLEFNAKGEITKVKIIDFGLACYQEDVKAMKARCGTLNYTAPEILMGKDYDYAVDIFSLGCIMYFMIRGSLPFYSDDQYIVAKKTVDGDYELDNDDFFLNVSEECRTLIEGMLEHDPKQRTTIMEAITSDWIAKGETLKKYNNKNREHFDLNDYL